MPNERSKGVDRVPLDAKFSFSRVYLKTSKQHKTTVEFLFSFKSTEYMLFFAESEKQPGSASYSFSKLVEIYRMLCEKSQFNLAVGKENLAPNELLDLENHLGECLACRRKSAQYLQIKNRLKSLERPKFSAARLDAVKLAVAAQMSSAQPERKRFFSPEVYEWLQMRVMPYAVGVAGALVIGFLLIWFLMVNNLRNIEFARLETPKSSTVFLNEKNFGTVEADSQLAISGASPSINPTGALLSMTKSLVSGQSADDQEVVVVADVFSNGLARIAEVVEPKSDARKMRELEKALQSDPDFAPFLPAKIDSRSETVRVIFKIQRVDVIESASKKKK